MIGTRGDARSGTAVRSPGMESLAGIKARLDRLCAIYGPTFPTEDPIRFPRRYAGPEDREIVAFISAALAYGRLAQIGRSIEAVLSTLGESPARAVRRLQPVRTARALSGFSHRFNSGRDVTLMLWILGRMLRRHGSLNAAFLEGYRRSHRDVGPALSDFCRRAMEIDLPDLPKPRGGPARAGVRWFFSSPADGSACKRMNMFLRWVVRRRGVDLGLWRGVPASKLVMPLDTHVARVSRRLGFSRRRSADWRMALEVTAALRRLAPRDPVRYDYAIYNWDLSLAAGGGTRS